MPNNLTKQDIELIVQAAQAAPLQNMKHAELLSLALRKLVEVPAKSKSKAKVQPPQETK